MTDHPDELPPFLGLLLLFGALGLIGAILLSVVSAVTGWLL